MDTLIFILVIVGFYFSIYLIGKIAKTISQVIETRRYKVKLKEVAPQLERIDLDNLTTEVSMVMSEHVSLSKIIKVKYRIDCDEEVKSISQYIDEEATYRRKHRKRPTQTQRYYSRRPRY